MSQTIKIRKGLDINLKGKAEQVYGEMPTAETYAIKPTDFPGLLPKLNVKEGQTVQAGDVLFHDKANDRVRFCSPVSGEIAEVRRGAKRKILEVVILADKEVKYSSVADLDPAKASREEIIDFLLDNGAWPFVKMRPYGTIANPSDTPKAIFISGFDSAPLGPDLDFVLHGQEEAFAAGVSLLSKLTEGAVNLSVDGKSAVSKVYSECPGLTIHSIQGPHPAGNVGVQIHHISPMNSGEVVWTLAPEDVAILGRLLTEKKYNVQRNVAVTGSEVEKPKYYKIIQGANLSKLFAEVVKSDNPRYISGNVLTGTQIAADGFMGFYPNQITVIPEGGEDEFLGWVLPGFGKFSISKTFTSWLTPNKEYVLDANLHGEERAFVVTGEYEKVFPFDIYPVQLLKSILIKDIEKMEQLGIYEVVEEDFALCEVVCTSKLEVQKMVREGLDFLKSEMS
ncbi:MAG: Na(+)-translocating NADH-quinone reductase subunit A [Schleiferiaceae bacterium]